MTTKANGNKVEKASKLGFGDRADNSFQNFTSDDTWMQKVDRGTLKINPEFAKMPLDEILTRSGLNFPVELKTTNYEIDGVWYPSKSHSVVRMDTKQELGNGFASGYSPISYPDILSQFFQGAIDLGGIPTRGISFDNGAKGAIQFVMPEQYIVADMLHKVFLNFISSHDGTYGVTLNVADIRIICGNTFAYVEGDTTAKWVIKHTKYMQKKLDDIRPQILKVEYAQKAYYNMLEKAAKVELSFNLQKEFLNAMFPDKDVKPGENVNQGPANRRINLENAIGQSVAERNSSIPTIYDAFQGMTRYISYRNQNRTPDQQYEYAMKSPDNQSAYQWMVDALK